MTNPTLCFIGSGNMATSLIGGLINEQYPAQNIIACDIDAARLEQLQQRFKIQVNTDNNLAIQQADIIILAVKPQVLQPVCRAISQNQHQPLFISIAAGIREGDINRWLGGERSIVRCMPNTPALVGLGASALYANPLVSTSQKENAENIMHSTGITVWVDNESQLDSVTAISGSGPAYFFLFIEALEKSALAMGLPKDTAARLARQTALGSATMALEEDVITLRQQVTSKGGTTEQAIASFQQQGLMEMVQKATFAAQQRSTELAAELGKDEPV